MAFPKKTFFLALAACASAAFPAADAAAGGAGCPLDADGRAPAAGPCARVVGRALVAPADGSLGAPGALVFGWPGTIVEMEFTGTSFAIEIGSPDVYLELCADGNCRKERVKGGMREVVVASGLKAGKHRVRLAQLSETISSAVEIGRVRLDRGASLLPRPKGPDRRIEAIGDSYTVGYGVESRDPADTASQGAAGRECDEEKLRATTNTQRAQAAVAARLLGADVHVDAFSGIGLLRAYNGSEEFLAMPEYYGRTVPHLAAQWDPARPAVGEPWRPQVVVVAMGTNDFSTELQAHEKKKWADAPAFLRAWKAEYRSFLARLRKTHPGAKFVLVSTNIARTDEFAAAVREIAADEERAGNRDVVAVDLPSLTQYGCHWHPDLATQEKNGRRLAEEISRLTGWPAPRR